MGSEMCIRDSNNSNNLAKMHCDENQFLTGIEVNLVYMNGVRSPNNYKFFCASKSFNNKE